MTITIPTEMELLSLLGQPALAVWNALVTYIHDNHVMDVLWGKGGRGGLHEMKFRRGGKTLCALYTREGAFGFMVILGKKEREQFDHEAALFSPKTCHGYDEATTYHDGKWLVLEMTDLKQLDDAKRLLNIKRKPNRKV